QILIAEGHPLHGPEMGIPKQEDITTRGYAIQCRITSEDPLNNFMPDTGKITVYRSSGGFGVRLDAGNAFQGAVISPYYDSLLVKVSTFAMTFENAVRKMVRTLQEFRIRGIKTNIPFLVNVIQHEKFISGENHTSFVDETPELFEFPVSQDRATKLLTYIGDIVVNGFPGIGKVEKPVYAKPRMPKVKRVDPPAGTKQIFDTY